MNDKKKSSDGIDNRNDHYNTKGKAVLVIHDQVKQRRSQGGMLLIQGDDFFSFQSGSGICLLVQEVLHEQTVWGDTPHAAEKKRGERGGGKGERDGVGSWERKTKLHWQGGVKKQRFVILHVQLLLRDGTRLFLLL